MKNVYLLYVDGDVVGAFSTTEKADDYADSMELDRDADVYIETHQIDPVPETDLMEDE